MKHLCSVGWVQRGTHLFVGTNQGKVQVMSFNCGSHLSMALIYFNCVLHILYKEAVFSIHFFIAHLYVVNCILQYLQL
jgi:hypothetical protein